MNILDLKGKVALVTGAGQGVGRQIALHLSAQNACVAVNDFVLERAEAVVREIVDAGGRALAVQCDVTNFDGVRAMFAAVSEALGPVDILVNNAGNQGTHSRVARKQFWESTPQDWDRFIGVNLYGVMNCVSSATPAMMKKGSGRLITIISDAGRMGEAGLEVYSGAKAGAAGYMRAVARTLGRYNVTSNCIAIAATMTPTVAPELEAQAPERTKKMLERYVIRRFGQPEDVAGLVLFLASDSSSWITGQTYPVNGGFSFGM
ncbi:SDR family NAD(P)-dependent oxidoreductase [Ferrovibrio sp.]|uniref:SDR family NAD(P)-dependent oxidoreductase n=1 Tax=Ferrovibrio sp. TaxID=1917215 RepID=UPI003D14ADB7